MVLHVIYDIVVASIICTYNIYKAYQSRLSSADFEQKLSRADTARQSVWALGELTGVRRMVSERWAHKGVRGQVA
jgi:hypothetical protein